MWQAPTQPDREAIEDLIGKYEKAVNNGDADGASEVFATDAVLMPDGAPAQVGEKAIRSYIKDFYFQTSVQIEMNIAEIVVLGDWALARTENSGTATSKDDGSSETFSTKSLFVVGQTETKEWKVARYAWNPNNQ
jgi:uncharacterized protein (TIGR02246 family)